MHAVIENTPASLLQSTTIACKSSIYISQDCRMRLRIRFERCACHYLEDITVIIGASEEIEKYAKNAFQAQEKLMKREQHFKIFEDCNCFYCVFFKFEVP